MELAFDLAVGLLFAFVLDLLKLHAITIFFLATLATKMCEHWIRRLVGFALDRFAHAFAIDSPRFKSVEVDISYYFDGCGQAKKKVIKQIVEYNGASDAEKLTTLEIRTRYTVRENNTDRKIKVFAYGDRGSKPQNEPYIIARGTAGGDIDSRRGKVHEENGVYYLSFIYKPALAAGLNSQREVKYELKYYQLPFGVPALSSEKYAVAHDVDKLNFHLHFSKEACPERVFPASWRESLKDLGMELDTNHGGAPDPTTGVFDYSFPDAKHPKIERGAGYGLSWEWPDHVTNHDAT